MNMVEIVDQDMRSYLGKPMSLKVRKALSKVPRHEFVPQQLSSHAYENRPLPIGNQQTISQPFIVALMTELLALQPTDRVLELGTGSGYQAAVAAEVAASVYSIEIIKDLAEAASQRLNSAGYKNVQVRHGDGRFGWPEEAPFDAIVVTAAGDIPEALLEQLGNGGRLVIPVGKLHEVQQLKLITRVGDGFTERDVLPVRFVPITQQVR